MTAIGTPLTAGATRVMLLGSGELGKEVALEAMRLEAQIARAVVLARPSTSRLTISDAPSSTVHHLDCKRGNQ